MTTANGKSVPLRRRREAAFPRAIAPRSARTPGARMPAQRPSNGLGGTLVIAGLIGVLASTGPARAQGFGDADPFRSATDAIEPGLPGMSGQAVQIAALVSPAVAMRPAVAAAAAPAPTVRPGTPRAACLDATRAAEARHDLPAGILVAIALNESGLHSYAMNVRGRTVVPRTHEQALAIYRANRGAVMAGCVQVNARVHARGQEWPLDANSSAEWAARFLRATYARTGSWAESVRIWHGGRAGSTVRYACRLRTRLDVTAPGSGLFSELNCGGGNSAYAQRQRRSVQAHYEYALAE